jgi:Flp pilus assembly protein protease CpaA
MVPFVDPTIGKVIIQVAMTAWMASVAIIDHRRGRIPNALTAPVFLVVGAGRMLQAVRGERVLFLLLVVWAVIFALWMLHFLGGGDAKFLMALYALFPSMEFTAVLALILLVEIVPIVLLQARGASLPAGLRSLRSRLVTMQLLPTEVELQARGRRYAWTFAVPAVLYAWLWW